MLTTLKGIKSNNFKWLFQSLPNRQTVLKQKIRPRGRPAKFQQHPEIIDIVTECLNEDAVAAHEKRHNSYAYSCGKSARELRQVVVKRVSKLKGKISVSTIRCLMLAPHLGRRASKSYRGLIAAKTPHRRNDKIENEHPDFSYTCSTINRLLDFAFGLCPQECLIMSCDTMNKVYIIST